MAVGLVLGLVEGRSVICRRGNAQGGSTAEAHAGGGPRVAVGPYGPSYPLYPEAGYGFTPIRPEDEIAALEESKKNLQEELKGIEARIEELQKPSKKESA